MVEEFGIKNRILESCNEMFCKFGYLKVTMEEIASNLCISKKTLYKHFSNKEHLVRELVEKNKTEINSAIEKLISSESTDFFEKLKNLMDFISKQSKKLQGLHIQELIKNHPDIWKEIQEWRKKNILEQFSKLISEGMEKGMFRNDVDKNIVVLLYMAAVHELINPDVFAVVPLSAEQIFSNIIKIVFEGILSEEGRAKYSTLNFQLDNNGVKIC